MAGEWIAVDLGIPDKPETQELIDLTGEPVEVVVFRLFRLWSWASMNTADGIARMTVARLARTCGADEAFWRAVSTVGWLIIDEEAGTITIPGWDRRFSQAAKSRLQAADRKAAHDDRRSAQEPPKPAAKQGSGAATSQERQRVPAQNASAFQDGTAESRRGEEIRSPPPPREASLESEGDPIDWQTFRETWNQGTGRRWGPPTPPSGWEEVATVEWRAQAIHAITLLPKCRYFTEPVTLVQFVKPGFVEKLLGGQYAAPKQARGSSRPDDRPAVKGWQGDDQARFEATRAKAMKELQQEGKR